MTMVARTPILGAGLPREGAVQPKSTYKRIEEETVASLKRQIEAYRQQREVVAHPPKRPIEVQREPPG